MDRTTQALVRKLIDSVRAPVKTGIERGRLREFGFLAESRCERAAYSPHVARFFFNDELPNLQPSATTGPQEVLRRRVREDREAPPNA